MMNDKQSISGNERPSTRKSSLWMRLSVLLSVLGFGAGLLLWQKWNEPKPRALPPEVLARFRENAAKEEAQRKLSAETQRKLKADWEEVQRKLNAELDQHRPATEAYFKQRRERLLAGRFELPIDALNNAQLQAAKARFRRRDVDVYRQHSADTGAAREAALTFLEAYFDEYEQGTPPHERQSIELGRAALAAGARDPVFVIYQAIGEFIVGEHSPELVARLEPKLDELAATGHSPMAVFQGRRWLVSLATDNRTGHQHERALAAIEAAKQYAVTSTDDPLEPRVVFENLEFLYEKLRPNQRRQLVTALTDTEEVDPWHRHLWAGQLLINEGWTIRGGGYADTVGAAQWKQFHEHLERAARHLRYAWQLHPTFPEAATKMITVGMGDSRHLPGAFWFFEAAWAQPDYFPAYNRYLSDLLPRWGGSHEQMIEFGNQCLQTGRYDLNVPQYLLYAIHAVEEDLEQLGEDKTQCVAVAGAVPALKRLATEMQQKKDKLGRTWLATTTVANRSSLAKYLVLAEEYKLVAEVLEAVDDPFDDSYLEMMEIGSSAQRAIVHGLAGPHAAEYLRLKDDLLAMFRNPATGPEPDELVRRSAALRERDPSATMQNLFHFIEQRVELRRAFDRGEWVRLPINSDDDGLWWYWHDWRKFPEDDVVEFGNTAGGKGIQMALRMRFPIPFEVEATVEQLGVRSMAVPVGLLIGDFHSHNRTERRPHAAVTLNDHGELSPIEGLEMLSLLASSGSEQHFMIRSLIGRLPNQRLGMLVWPDTFEAIVGGNSSRPEGKVQSQYVAANEIAIGWRVPNANAGLQHLRVASPRIRKLPYGSPPAPDAPVHDREKYFTDVLRVHPDSVRAHRSLAVLLAGRDPEASRRHVARALELNPLIGDMHKLRGKEHLARSEYAAALQEFDAEFRVSPAEPDVRVWLARLLCGVPDDALRDPARAARVAEETEKLVKVYGEADRKPVFYGRPMLLAEQGQFDEALQALDVLEPVVADDDAELQWIAQQRAAFSQRKPFRFQPLVDSVPSALAPVNVAKPAADSNRQ